MELLVDAVENDRFSLVLLQFSHIPENREDLSIQLRDYLSEITGRKPNLSKDVYSDFFNFLRYDLPSLC